MLGVNRVHCGLFQNGEKALGHVLRASSKKWPRTNHLKNICIPFLFVLISIFYLHLS